MNIWPKYGISTGIVPAGGGWRFPQQMPGGGCQLVEASEADELLEKVRILRIENALPMGDPANDIASFIRSQSPINDTWRYRSGEYAVPEVSPGPREVVPLIEMLKAWLVGMASRQVNLVREDEAIKRAQICAGCPQNIKWEVGCTSCNEDIYYRSNNLRQRPIFQLDKKLKGCRLHRFPIQSAIFIDRDNLPPRHTQAPSPCWVQNEQQI